MPIRALIVLLAVLNLGVAVWWMSRPPPSPPPPALPTGVAQLQLVETTPDAGSPASAAPAPATQIAAATPAVPVPPASPAAVQCYSLGPYAEAGMARAAAERLRGQVLNARPRALTAATGNVSGYRVLIAAAESREAAQATAQRIGAAGFNEYLVIGNGEEANSIALGRYRSRDAALRRQEALRAAGFAAQLLPIGGEAGTQWWLDIALGDLTDGSGLREVAASAQSMPLDCAALR
jgi:cell division septation protein DedD